jgi:transmembrane sensor
LYVQGLTKAIERLVELNHVKDYAHLNVLELTQDEDFIKWVKYPEGDSEFSREMDRWLMENPSKKEIVDEARTIILAVTGEKQYIPGEQKKREILARIDETIDGQEGQFDIKPVGRKRSWYAIAATVSVIAILSVWYYKQSKSDFSFIHDTSDLSYSAENEFIKFSNDGSKAYTLTLSDGTKVTLQPHSSIHYPETFIHDRRDVRLSGEAFFEVSRDPQKPFSVYTNELVTRVLGTSFNIRAYEKERDITVAVRTGKVSVFKNAKKRTAHEDGQKSDAALLKPNQQVVFSKTESKLVKSLVENPVVLGGQQQHYSFQFSDTPISNVFARMEEAYGVEIVYDKEVLSACYLNASLDNLPFLDQLRLICKGIDAKYEILETNIIISGKGCNQETF